MVLNMTKYIYIVNTLAKHGWGYYKRDNSTVIWWVDPLMPAVDMRTKDAYIAFRERCEWDGHN